MGNLAPASQSTRLAVCGQNRCSRENDGDRLRIATIFRVSETNDFDRRNVFRTGFQGLFIFEGAATGVYSSCSGHCFSHVYLGFRKSEQDVFDVHTNHLQDKTRQNERAPRLFESNRPFILEDNMSPILIAATTIISLALCRLQSAFRRTQLRHAEGARI